MEWVMTDKIKPPEYMPVLVATSSAFINDFGTVQIAIWKNHMFWNLDMKPIIAEYWFPLPPHPKE